MTILNISYRFDTKSHLRIKVTLPIKLNIFFSVIYPIYLWYILKTTRFPIMIQIFCSICEALGEATTPCFFVQTNKKTSQISVEKFNSIMLLSSVCMLKICLCGRPINYSINFKLEQYQFYCFFAFSIRQYSPLIAFCLTLQTTYFSKNQILQKNMKNLWVRKLMAKTDVIILF